MRTRLLAPERPDSPAGTTWWLGSDGTPGPVLRDCLIAAAAAPSVHNTQPWLFDPRHRGVDVYADLSRQVPVIDPTGRELLMSVGAAVFNLRVSVRAHGRIPMQVIHPTRRAAELVVRVSPGAPATVPYTARALARAIPQRRSNRWPFSNIPFPHRVLSDLAKAAATEGATLRALGRDGRRYVLDLVREAEQQWQEDLAYRHELARWTSGRTARRDGVPLATTGPGSPADHMPLRDLGLVQPRDAREEVRFERWPTLAVLYTEDGPQHWLRAGQALQRALLTATVHGVAATLMTQPLEIPRLRELMRDPWSGRPAQAIIRFGYSRRPASPSPRRPLADLLHKPARARVTW